MTDGARQNKRLARDFELVWAIEGHGVSGRGRLVDVSLGGACIQLNQDQPFDKGQTMSIVCSRLSALPSKSTIMWIRRSKGQTLCGIRFHQDTLAWTSWFAQQVAAA